MSVQAIIQALDVLISVHKKLINVSEQKTEILKEGSLDKFQKILREEQQHILLLERAEQHRQKQVSNWAEKQGYQDEDLTISGILERIENPEEAKQLEGKTVELTEHITTLKQNEQLNESLIVQSMQFVQVSLNMLSPTLDNFNYGKTQRTQPIKRSAFDSKA